MIYAPNDVEEVFSEVRVLKWTLHLTHIMATGSMRGHTSGAMLPNAVERANPPRGGGAKPADLSEVAGPLKGTQCRIPLSLRPPTPRSAHSLAAWVVGNS
jgi:hypothetical protein